MTTTDKYKKFPSLKLYDRLGVPYVLFDQPWEGPLWTGHCMMLSLADSYGDAGFFHELCHWIEASPTQRRLPDFALGRSVTSTSGVFTSSTTIHLFSGSKRTPYRRRDRNDGWGEKTVSLAEATRQEVNACTALWFYEPIAKLTPWTRLPTNVNTAAYDFNMISDIVKTTHSRGMSNIARTLNLDWDNVKSYAALVRTRLKDGE